ncbi:hypothetical protein [Dyadobacter fermentans]|uniref:hypothetical protein n=1 Tax=Dyadobacter fermentans TaxID=94254 RepID=UPI001CC15F86|nr:hypothetical protein [Dyadobacter fermentans]MBZ1361651.1 hypothetical protein [Dyadobacter fermentans]
MDKFSNVTLGDIGKLNRLLRDILVDDPVKNFDNGKQHEELIEEIDGCILNFLDNFDATENRDYGKLYRNTKEQGNSVSVLLGRQRDYFAEKLKEFRKEYVAESRDRLFTAKLTDMTGKDFNEYLQLIGLLK